MKTNKEYLIYTNNPYDFNKDETLRDICELRKDNEYPGCENCLKHSCEGCENCPSDEELWNRWDDSNEILWEDITREVKYFDEQGTYLVIASLGLWNGSFDGGKIIDGYLSEAIGACFEDYNKVYWQDKNLKVKAIHHDGTNHFVIKKLTDRGIEFYNNHYYDYDDRTMHQKLFKDAHYSHSVDFFAKLYGWVKDRKEVISSNLGTVFVK